MSQNLLNTVNSEANSFSSSTTWSAKFTVNGGGWNSFDTYPRAIGDVDGDGKADMVGFSGGSGVRVGLSIGTSFNDPTTWSTQFPTSSWTSFDAYPRLIGDVNGDGKEDIIGFSASSVYVALSTGSNFSNPTIWSTEFTPNNGGWNSYDVNPRMVVDVNGDGKADIIGFGASSVHVALSTGSSFASSTTWIAEFTPNNGGWNSYDVNPRMVVDVNGDGKADIIGFGASSVHVALSTGSSFASSTTWISEFTPNNGGWNSYDVNPRMISDVNGDGKADIIGFSCCSVSVSLSTGSSFASSTTWSTEFAVNSGWTSFDTYPRFVKDVNGDNNADIIGCGTSAVSVSLSNVPTPSPTVSPTSLPTSAPTSTPSGSPTNGPTGEPSAHPSAVPTLVPVSVPTSTPSGSPTGVPIGEPSAQPSISPTAALTFSTTTNLQNGLVAYYPFNGNANDESGNGNDGVVHSAVLSADRYGNPLSSYNFNGNAYIEIDGTSFNFLNNLSISMWMKPANSQVTYAGLIDKSHANSHGEFVIQQSGGTNNRFYFGYQQFESNSFSNAVGDTYYIDTVTNCWNHLTITKQNNLVHYYLNGSLVTVEPTSTSSIATNGNLPLLIGAENGGLTSPASGIYRQYNGDIDDVYIYNRSLTSNEVQQLYTFNSSIMQPTIAPSITPTIIPSSESSMIDLTPSSTPSSVPTFTSMPTHIVAPPTSAEALNIDLGSLANNQGFNVTGASSGEYSGYSVKNAGDVNGDGRNDIIIGAYKGSPNGKFAAGITYVIYGGVSLDDINLANLNSLQGFSIYGENTGDNSGWSVSGIGDFNGDGYDDVVIGAPFSDGGSTGTSYLIFGNKTIENIYLSNLSPLEGFYIFAEGYSHNGWSVSGAGDVNDDGLSDVVIGTKGLGNHGIAYILYGNSTTTNITLTSLTYYQGFSITGAQSGDGDRGMSVSEAGDINGDGYADVIVGLQSAPFASGGGGISYVIYGGTALTNVNLASLNANQGFAMYGCVGSSVSGVGDINNDGFNDVAIGGSSQTCVVYGKISFTFVNLQTLTSSQGFYITGATSNSVSGAGDFNKDGYADLIIGAPNADPDGRADAGISYLIYGGPSLKNVNVDTLTFSQGIVFSGGQAGETSGYSVSEAGDVNEDGYGDVIIGAYQAGIGSLVNQGISYIVYGNYFTMSPTAAPTHNPTASPTLEPTIIPTATPTLEPTAVPSITPTFTPTETPSVMPTANPTVSPTLEPTKTTTAMPSVVPSLTPTTSTTALYQEIDITTGGTYTGTASNENFIINSALDTTITGGGGIDLFTIRSYPDVLTTITDFNPVNEQIDLTSFSNIHGKNDLNITSGSAIVNLPNNQKIRLLNLVPNDLKTGNFVFSNTLSPTLAPTISPPESSGISADDAKAVLTAGSALGSAGFALANYLCRNFFWDNGVNIKFLNQKSQQVTFRFCNAISLGRMKKLARDSKEASYNHAKIAASDAEVAANKVKQAAEDMFTEVEGWRTTAASASEVASNTATTAATLAKSPMTTATIAEKLKRMAVKAEEIAEEAIKVKTNEDAEAIKVAANKISEEAKDIFKEAEERVNSATIAKKEHYESLESKKPKINKLNQEDTGDNEVGIEVVEQGRGYDKVLQSDLTEQDSSLPGAAIVKVDDVEVALGINSNSLQLAKIGNDQQGSVLLCIDASMDSEYIKLQDKAFLEFGTNLNHAGEEFTSSHNKLLSIENNIASSNNIDYSSAALFAQQTLEYAPTIRYFFKVLGIDLPQVYLPNEAWTGVHFVAGAVKVGGDSFLCLGQTIESGTYYARLVLTDKLAEAGAGEQPTDLISFAKTCSKHIAIGGVLGLGSGAPAYGAINGAAICLSQYQMLEESAEQTAIRYTVDFVAGSMAVYGLSDQNIFSQAIGIVSAVSMSDIATKVAMATAELGTNGVCGLFESSDYNF